MNNGTVLVSYGSHGVVQLDDGEKLACQYRRQVGRPFCGDRVVVQKLDDNDGVVEEVLPRSNYFVRADRQQRKHTIAANLDQVFVVIARRPLPSRDLLERYLVAIHSLAITPIIVINKTDLPAGSPSETGAVVLTRKDQYQALGYTVIETSCKQEPGISQLAPLIADKTSILVGQSGVGKSSLIRGLLPDLDIQVGALSDATGKGTHTTTTTMLYKVPGGGFLMDSPGVWEYGLWRLEDEEVAQGFVEFQPHLNSCRFNNCLHNSEPGCAIKDAVKAGHIADWRYESYLRLLQQNAEGF